MGENVAQVNEMSKIAINQRWDVDSLKFTASKLKSNVARVEAIGFHPESGSGGDHRWGEDETRKSFFGELIVKSESGGAGFIGEADFFPGEKIPSSFHELFRFRVHGYGFRSSLMIEKCHCIISFVDVGSRENIVVTRKYLMVECRAKHGSPPDLREIDYRLLSRL